MTKANTDIVRKSISLSGAVAQWADDLAHEKGFGTNFSAYIADLIRHDRQRAEQSRAFSMAGEMPQVNSLTKGQAAEQVVAVVQKMARRTSARRK
jgi:hypothetical protein